MCTRMFSRIADSVSGEGTQLGGEVSSPGSGQSESTCSSPNTGQDIPPNDTSNNSILLVVNTQCATENN